MKTYTESVNSIDFDASRLELALPLPTFVPRRYRPGNLGTWSGHLAFANDLIAAVQPSLIVELGTHYGESYFTFCQSVVENGLSCLCYAIDHWQGEEHAGYYGEEVFEEVQQYNEACYKSFSYLLRASFDDAVSQFANETIDLLHIDGLHTFDAINHDFRTWLPKVKPGGLILMHDIAVRHADFGVWSLWDKLTVEFAETFAFHHWWGLGVLRKPGAGGGRPPLLDLLFDGELPVQERIRRHYVIYTSHLENMLRSKNGATGPDKGAVPVAGSNQEAISSITSAPVVQVFPFGLEGHSESTSLSQNIQLEQWSTLVFDFPEGIGNGPLRVDPADCTGVIQLSGISLQSQPSGNTLWAAQDAAALHALRVSGSATSLLQDDRCLLLSHGTDPQILLPQLPAEHGAVRMQISLKVSRSLDAMSEALSYESRNTSESIQRVRASADAEISGLRAELMAAHAERMLAATELSQVAAERNQANRELKRLQQAIDSARLRAAEEDAARTAAQAAMESEQAARHVLELEIASLRNALESGQRLQLALQNSLSWRVTKPARWFMHLLRNRS